MTSKVNLIYTLEGDIEGISVFELSPILLSLGNLIQTSNRIVNPEGSNIEVNVKPFKKGSFSIELTLFASSTAQQIMDIFHSASTEQITLTLAALGLVQNSSGVTLIDLFRKLKGGAKSAEIKGDVVNIVDGDGNIVTVNKNIYNLYLNGDVKAMVINTFTRPMMQDCITGISSYIADAKEKTIKKFDKPFVDDVSEAIEKSVIPTEQIREIEDTAVLTVIKAVFERSTRKWEFVYNGNRVSASIQDDAFFEKLARHEIAFTQGATLKAKLKIKQIWDPYLKAFLNSTYYVTEVLEWNTPKRLQGEMDF